MIEARLVLATAAAQVGEIARRIHRLTLERFISFATFVALLTALGVAFVAVVVLQSASYGSSLASTAINGATLLSGVLFVCGSLAGAVGLLISDLWFRHVLAERERLAILPLGRRALTFLALVPTLFPVFVGVCVAVLSILAFCWGMRASPITPLSGFALGLTFALAIGLIWAGLSRVRGLRLVRVGALTVATVAAITVHAGWTIIDPARSESAPHRWSPMVVALSLDEPFAAWQSASILVGLTAAVWLTVAVGQLPRAQGARLRPAHRRGIRARQRRWAVPASWRVPVEVCSTIIRQSSLVTELGVAVIVCAGAAWISGRMDSLGRAEAADATLLVVAAFSALPILGLRSALGPVRRLWLLGARANDVRRGFVLAAVSTQAVGLVAAVAVLLATSMTLRVAVLLFIFATLTFGLAVLIANVMRAVADISVGRAAASLALMAPVMLMLFTGATQMQMWLVGGVAFAAGIAGLGVLRLTLHEQVLT